MRKRYELAGRKRKQLCDVISKVTGEVTKYLGTPTYAYQIGDIIVDRDATVIKLTKDTHQAILEAGFSEVKQEESNGFTISLPILEDEHLGKLENLLIAKERLIKKALQADRISFEIISNQIQFPWFDEIPDREAIEGTVIFIEKVMQYVKERKFISAKVMQTDNEKYSFRTFLLALGMIGPEYKEVRRTLLKELDGNSAFRHPKEVSHG